MGKLLNTEEVAERLNTSPSTIRYWHGEGTGPKSFKLGRRRLYAEEDVDAYIEKAKADERLKESV